MRSSRSVLAVCGSLGLCGPIFAQTIGVPQTVIGGGSTATGGAYEVTSTIGEAGAGGPLAGGPYSVNGGFWGGPGLTLAPNMTLDRTSLVFGTVTNGSAFVFRTPAQNVRLIQS